jgi:predicted ATP-grasp superfamily ATP-dependent carboligase
MVDRWRGIKMTPPSFSVLIPDGESDFALFVIHGFINFPQVKLYVLSNQRWAPARFSRYCHKYIFKKCGTDVGERFDVIAEVVRQNPIDVILPVEMEWIAPQGAKRHALSELAAIAPVLDSKSFKLVNNKWLLFKLMQRNGIPAPQTILCTLDGDFEQQVRDLEFPVLIKPVTAWGGEGIQCFDHISQLYRFLKQCDSEKIKNRYIVQSFLTGYVIGLNILCQEGEILAYTMQRGFIPNPQEYAAAAAIQFIRREDVLELGKKLVSALKYNGVANVDMFYDTRKKQIKVLEVNARFWGSLRGSYIACVSFPYLACLAALAIPFPIPEYELTRYVHPKTALKEGMLRVLGKGQYYEKFPLEETGLRYMLADPIAETLRALRQQLSNDRWQ